MRILAVDLGERRLGMAICDEEEIIPSPLCTETVRSLEQALAAVLKAVQDNGARRVVVGHPRRMDGRAGPAARTAEAFAKAIGEAGVEVALWDERLTTAEAERTLRDAGLSRKARKGRVDRLAAQRILSSYLATRKRGISGQD